MNQSTNLGAHVTCNPIKCYGILLFFLATPVAYVSVLFSGCLNCMNRDKNVPDHQVTMPDT